jgi:two-component system LytT family sensor kinase
MDFQFFTEERFLLDLLLRLAFMAGYASLLLGFRPMQRVLFSRERGIEDRVRLAFLFGLVFAVGGVLRVYLRQEGADLTLEGALLAGIVGGTRVGFGAGVLAGLAPLVGGEYLTTSYLAFAGILGGLSVRVLGAGEEFWHFTLNPVTNVGVLFGTLSRERRLDGRAAAFFLCILLAGGRAFLEPILGPARFHGFHFESGVLLLLDLAVSVSSLGIAVKILSDARSATFRQQEESELMRARLSTLRSQVNPHFLFNTLNSISSLIRIDPEKAREMVRRLSEVFRKSLDLERDYVSVAEELEFIDNYLGIETVRFGEDRLRVEKRIEKETLNDLVPALILQPLLENAIKHGASKGSGPTAVRIEAKRVRNRLHLEVEDSGPGLEDGSEEEVFRNGVGLRNVRDRIRTAYGEEARFALERGGSGGLRVVLEFPAAPRAMQRRDRK